MAGTMLDNMNGRLTLMQSAADGLKIAIGEDLTPVMSDLYDVGAEVLGWMQGFVEENPGVVKGIAAGTVTLGGLVGTLTAVSAGIKTSSCGGNSVHWLSGGTCWPADACICGDCRNGYARHGTGNICRCDGALCKGS